MKVNFLTEDQASKADENKLLIKKDLEITDLKSENKALRKELQNALNKAEGAKNDASYKLYNELQEA